jgi:hypothetical protein
MWREEYTSALRAIFEVIPDTFTEEAAKFLENGLLEALGAPFGASKAARKLFHEHISEAYMGGKKEFVKSSTSLADHRAINVLTKHNCFWLGQRYGERIGPNIAELTQRALDTGVGREVLAEDLKAALGGAAPADYNYWDVVASSALVRGRSFGCVAGMVEARLEYYEVLAMMDERTCPICGEMNGRVFSVAEAQKTINAVLSVTDPSAFKAALPWQTKPAKGVDNKTLMNEGKAVPPFHGRCRCALIAAEEAALIAGNDIIEQATGATQGLPIDVFQSVKQTNPKYAPNTPYSINCQRCVPTYELRRRGYDVEALPNLDNSYSKKVKEVASVWQNPQIQKVTAPKGTCSTTISVELEKQVEAWGEGARAQVVVGWAKSARGHTFVVETVNGKAVLIDPLNNTMRAVNDYIKKARQDFIYYWRIDNLAPDPEALPKITKAREKK